MATMEQTEDRVLAGEQTPRVEMDQTDLESALSTSLDVAEAATSSAHRAATLAAILLWGLAIAWGSLYGYWYEATPTATGDVTDRWPAESACVLSSDRPTLLMFVHPRCPCTRASLNELAVLMTRRQNAVNALVLFFQPNSLPEDWTKTDLWESASRIPGVVPRRDLAGAEHRRFGARVSGEVFLFLPSGDLAFHGGITAGRGHAGDNPGRAALESLLRHQPVPITATPVFGCELECPSLLPQQRATAIEKRADP